MRGEPQDRAGQLLLPFLACREEELRVGVLRQAQPDSVLGPTKGSTCFCKLVSRAGEPQE